MATIETPPPIVGHVKTTFREPDDICHSCEKLWTDKGKTPRIMVELPHRGDFGTRMYACPWCDGPVVDNAASAT
jgi:hypothetical protein